MNKKEAGRLGGLFTVARYGSAYMSTIGRRGAAVFWQRYTLQPVEMAAFAIVERSTNKVKALTNFNYGR